MKNLLKQIELRVPLTREEIKLVEEQFLTEELEETRRFWRQEIGSDICIF